MNYRLDQHVVDEITVRGATGVHPADTPFARSVRQEYRRLFQQRGRTAAGVVVQRQGTTVSWDDGSLRAEYGQRNGYVYQRVTPSQRTSDLCPEGREVQIQPDGTVVTHLWKPGHPPTTWQL